MFFFYLFAYFPLCGCIFCELLTLGLSIVDGAYCSFYLYAFVKENSDPLPVCLKHGANRLTVDTDHMLLNDSFTLPFSSSM